MRKLSFLSLHLITAVLLLAPSCGHESDLSLALSSPQEQAVPTTTTIQLVPPKLLEEFVLWTEKRSKEIATELGIPPIKVITIYVDTTPVYTLDSQVMLVYGFYNKEEQRLSIWTRIPLGLPYPAYADIPLEELKGVFYHEYLHHFDHVKGNPPAPADHNDIFKKRIEELGWK
jgi:hypothetical protein